MGRPSAPHRCRPCRCSTRASSLATTRPRTFGRSQTHTPRDHAGGRQHTRPGTCGITKCGGHTRGGRKKVDIQECGQGMSRTLAWHTYSPACLTCRSFAVLNGCGCQGCDGGVWERGGREQVPRISCCDRPTPCDPQPPIGLQHASSPCYAPVSIGEAVDAPSMSLALCVVADIIAVVRALLHADAVTQPRSPRALVVVAVEEAARAEAIAQPGVVLPVVDCAGPFALVAPLVVERVDTKAVHAVRLECALVHVGIGKVVHAVARFLARGIPPAVHVAVAQPSQLKALSRCQRLDRRPCAPAATTAVAEAAARGSLRPSRHCSVVSLA
eukprot:354625-Chlamydomonas_euryale.AAC.8